MNSINQQLQKIITFEKTRGFNPGMNQADDMFE